MINTNFSKVKIITFLLSSLLILTTVGCNNSTKEQGTKVTRSEFKEDWPLTVDEGYVDCTGSATTIFRHNGETYALNGTAMQEGYQRIHPIWAESPDTPTPKKNISPLRKKALEECN